MNHTALNGPGPHDGDFDHQIFETIFDWLNPRARATLEQLHQVGAVQRAGDSGNIFFSPQLLYPPFQLGNAACNGLTPLNPPGRHVRPRQRQEILDELVAHLEYETPHRAIVLQATWASVLVATGTYRALFTRVIYTEWIFFGLMVFGLFLLRRRSSYAPLYRAWGYPVLPAVFILASFFIVANQIVSEPRDSVIGLGIVVLGLPVYYFWTRRSAHDHRLS